MDPRGKNLLYALRRWPRFKRNFRGTLPQAHSRIAAGVAYRLICRLHQSQTADLADGKVSFSWPTDDEVILDRQEFPKHYPTVAGRSKT